MADLEHFVRLLINFTFQDLQAIAFDKPVVEVVKLGEIRLTTTFTTLCVVLCGLCEGSVSSAFQKFVTLLLHLNGNMYDQLLNVKTVLVWFLFSPICVRTHEFIEPTVVPQVPGVVHLSQIEGLSMRVHFYRSCCFVADFNDLNTIPPAVEVVQAKCGDNGLNLLVNNAGTRTCSSAQLCCVR